MIEILNVAFKHFERPKIEKKHDDDIYPKSFTLVLGEEGS